MTNEGLITELQLLEAEARSRSTIDSLEYLRSKGVPDAVVFRLARVARITIRVGRRVIKAGQLILGRLAEFLAANPGLAIGAALGAAVGMLASQVPLLGHLLAPVLVAMGLCVGAAIGRNVDRLAASAQPLPLTLAAIEAAHIFFVALVGSLRAAFAKGTVRIEGGAA